MMMMMMMMMMMISKAIPVMDCGGVYSCEILRILQAPAALYPQAFWYLFLSKAESDPGP
jgi:hypothetical protein